MTAYRTDEEQVELLRRWWRDHGKALLLGVSLAIAVLLAWEGWKQYRSDSSETLANDYQALMETVGEPGTALDDVRYTTAQHLAGKLKAQGKRSVYGSYGALLLARAAQDRGDSARALDELQWATEHARDADVRRLANLHWARALHAAGQTDAALARLDRETDPAYTTPLVEQLRGDILLSRGDRAAALAAYEKALAWISTHEAVPNRVLEIQRDALKQADAAETVPLPATPAEETR